MAEVKQSSGLATAEEYAGRILEVLKESCVYVPPAKDLREFVRLGGTRAMIENTLNNTIWNT